MIALFDLDGTILPWDTQKLFCHHVLHKHPWRRFFLLLFLPMLALAPILGSEGLKRVFLSFLWRLQESDVDQLARDFARQWLPLRAWPEMLEKIAWHKQRGDLTVLISASPEPYVREIGLILGFDHALGTVINFPAAGLPLFPDLVNNKGRNKVLRLRELLHSPYFNEDGKLGESHGYSDSSADLPMLALCRSVTLVNPNKKLAALGLAHDWNQLLLPRPWKSPLHRLATRILAISGLSAP
jgi:HAD superfamily hydrolase (TIGR01490 family)